MGSTTNEEYTSIFLELLRQVPYLKDEKVKIQRFISGFPVAFRDMMEFNELISLEDSIWKLKHCFEKSKLKSETKPGRKDNAKNKGKWDKKRVTLQDSGNKENGVPSKKFNASKKGQGCRSEEKNKEPVWCWNCGGDHRRRDFPQYQGGIPQIYTVQEAYTVRDVGQIILRIYVALDNKHADDRTSIIEMDGKLCDKVISILIDPGANYSYVNLDMMDKCGLRKEVHADSWLVQLAT